MLRWKSYYWQLVIAKFLNEPPRRQVRQDEERTAEDAPGRRGREI